VPFLWVETVRPAPAGYEVRFVGFKGDGDVLDVFFGGDAVVDEREMRGGPGEIKRGKGAEQVSAVDGPKPVSEDEVVDDAGPEIVGHAEGVGRHNGELFKAKERVGRKDERPDLMQVCVGEAEGFEHGGDVVGRLGDGGGLGDELGGLGTAGALPEGSFCFNIGEERAGDLGEERVEIGNNGLRQSARADGNLRDAVVDGGGFAEGPEESFVLSDGGEALRGGGEALCHAEGEADVDGERKAGARAAEGAGDGVEDGGVDEAFARTEIVVGQGEIALQRGSGQGADGLGVEGLSFGAEEDAGGGVVFLREFVGVEIVGCGEEPGCRGDGCWSVRDKAERASGGGLWGSVGCGDEHGFSGEGEGEVAERSVEGLLWQGGEADQKAAFGNSRRRGTEVDIGLGGGHRTILTFSVWLAAQILLGEQGSLLEQLLRGDSQMPISKPISG
jgi:hypothetical protein